jgi:hypothetical protein
VYKKLFSQDMSILMWIVLEVPETARTTKMQARLS